MTVANAQIVKLPPDGGMGGPVIWLETHAAWEQAVCIYEKTSNGWVLRGTEAKSGEGGFWEVFSLSSSTTYRTFLVWMLHKTSPSNPGQGWINSPTNPTYNGNNSSVQSGHPQYRDKQIIIGSEDSQDNDFNDGVVHFTYTSMIGSAKVEPFSGNLPDGFINAPSSIDI